MTGAESVRWMGAGLGAAKSNAGRQARMNANLFIARSMGARVVAVAVVSSSTS